MLDSWETGGVRPDPLGMGVTARGGLGILGPFAVLQISGGLCPPLTPLFLSDSGPAPLVGTVSMALTSVGQELSAPPCFLLSRTRGWKQIGSWSREGGRCVHLLWQRGNR